MNAYPTSGSTAGPGHGPGPTCAGPGPVSGVPLRAPTFTPLVRTVCPSTVIPAAILNVFGISPALRATTGMTGIPISSKGAVSQSWIGVGPFWAVAPLSHSGRSEAGIMVVGLT
ncbi:MAG: hypothetical protein ABI691_15295 [Ginsengibacter sp.]